LEPAPLEVAHIDCEERVLRHHLTLPVDANTILVTRAAHGHSGAHQLGADAPLGRREHLLRAAMAFAAVLAGPAVRAAVPVVRVWNEADAGREREWHSHAAAGVDDPVALSPHLHVELVARGLELGHSLRHVKVPVRRA
jgi:hypothetical protein